MKPASTTGLSRDILVLLLIVIGYIVIVLVAGKMGIPDSGQLLLGAVTAIMVYFIYVQARETRRQAEITQKHVEITGKYARLQAEIMLKDAFCTLYANARPATLGYEPQSILGEYRKQCSIAQYLNQVRYIESIIDLLESYSNILEIKDSHMNELIAKRRDLYELEELLNRLMKKCIEYKDLIGSDEGKVLIQNDPEIQYIRAELTRIAHTIDRAIVDSIRHNILLYRCYDLARRSLESQK